MLQNCLFGNIFYQSESDFCTITSRSLKSHFENALKFFHYTYTIEYGETQTHSFSALVPKTEKKSKLAKKCALTCSSISKGASGVRIYWSWKLRQFILFEKSWYSLMASSIKFNWMKRFRYLQLEPHARDITEGIRKIRSAFQYSPSDWQCFPWRPGWRDTSIQDT